MYINDVIRRVRAYQPNEYDLAELYLWCDEVSAMLTVEDRNVYRQLTLPVTNANRVILPEGVELENIEAVITPSGKKLSKSSLLYADAILSLPEKTESVRIIYQAPFLPIRLAKYIGSATIDIDAGTIKIPCSSFIAGDTLAIQLDGGVYGGILLMSVDYDGEGSYVLNVEPSSIESLPAGDTEMLTITRAVTESTVCDAPYDAMYIDYCLAKINMFQHDFNTYNQFMTSFNSRLAAYKRWLIERLPQKEGRFVNWW